MNILLVYPKYPDSFWSFKHALKFVSKKAGSPPLGLLTVASMMPSDWNIKLIDMNTTPLKDKEINWADYVCISAMSVQSESVDLIMERCKNLNKKIIAGGPLFTSNPDSYKQVDHLILNEAEITLPLFLADIRDNMAKQVYETEEWADITTTPVPQWNLIRSKNYSTMNIQYSRGCPYDCDFCDITVLYGRYPRTKTKEQVITELNALFDYGWRGPVFFVDDNFIGNKSKLKNEILPAINNWQSEKNFPFYFNTEASINISDDEGLMKQMVKAGFETVFVGIESPNEESLIECNKKQNTNRNMINSIKIIQKAGLEVQGGFIVGFDKDPITIFDKLTKFIQDSGIVTAMVGLLNAPKGTKLEKRLASEGRMLKSFTGCNTDFSINFTPKMNMEQLLQGYKKILDTIYSPKVYYDRVRKYLKDFNPVQKKVFHLNSNYILALFKSMLFLGIIGKERKYYWRLFFWSLFRKPRLFSLAITLSIYGFHFRKVSQSMF